MIFGQHPDRVKVGTVGEPILGVEWKMGDAGELLVRGDMVFQGYYKNADATAITVRGGWLHRATWWRNRDGRVRIVDRLKDIMIGGRQNRRHLK